jgi:hypothetical protein
MAKQGKSGGGSDAARLSQSPLEIRRGSAEPTDIHDSPVTSKTGDLGCDANSREAYGTDPWAAPGSEPVAP